MKYPKLRELKEAIKALFIGPYTTKYPKEPHIPPAGFRGKPTPNEDGCIGCGACAEVCPSGAIEVIDSSENLVRSSEKQQSTPNPELRTPNFLLPTRKLTWYYDRCNFCGQCERYCTTRDAQPPGIKLTLEFELATTDRRTLTSSVEKELLVCEECGEVLTTKAHFEWLINKLGPLAFGNFNLNTYSQKILLGRKEVSEVQFEKIDRGQIRRQDLYQINCPKCRHRVLVFNQTGK